MKYRVWFGEVEDGKVKLSDNFVESFMNACNEELPFNVFDLGVKVFGSPEKYYSKLRKTAIEVARLKAEKELRREDRYAIMLLKALDEIDESINLLENKLADVEEVKESEVTEEMQEEIRRLKGLRRRIEGEIEAVMGKIAPNLSAILGGVIAARLLEKVGSLQRLASLPASTIQILGAEKSLYKAMARMRKGKPAKIPKHGVIFQHPFIRTLPKKKRGKMARFMAAKLAIAARIDYFTGELKEELATDVRKKYEELRRA
ncbi:Pre-mRNA processing ribonucleoprotein-binding domain-containing protein [Archaeoglobus veneficus]|uniref:Pre-mRNA processing ribonucleoprotein, binding domain protein n=1 Tax=Archaeoglobus veneficus (strain DSM 11195 / SNP6) TaxID=693661 RepID=F2KN20_ARCVS|nr:Pre-mRNA processing ribonucleoprotein-binding domain-containing protein [Archaeoglobus veneficus]AEA47296.1 Pre-mRNA processing ribonucleoprotein, binding domain protein [Archaeoglobus veneficus SNP6]